MDDWITLGKAYQKLGLWMYLLNIEKTNKLRNDNQHADTAPHRKTLKAGKLENQQMSWQAGPQSPWEEPLHVCCFSLVGGLTLPCLQKWLMLPLFLLLSSITDMKLTFLGSKQHQWTAAGPFKEAVRLFQPSSRTEPTHTSLQLYISAVLLCHSSALCCVGCTDL